MSVRMNGRMTKYVLCVNRRPCAQANPPGEDVPVVGREAFQPVRRIASAVGGGVCFTRFVDSVLARLEA